MVTKGNSPMHLLSFPTTICPTVPNLGMSAERAMNPLKTPTTKTNRGKQNPQHPSLLYSSFTLGLERRTYACILFVQYYIKQQSFLIGPNR